MLSITSSEQKKLGIFGTSFPQLLGVRGNKMVGILQDDLRTDFQLLQESPPTGGVCPGAPMFPSSLLAGTHLPEYLEGS